MFENHHILFSWCAGLAGETIKYELCSKCRTRAFASVTVVGPLEASFRPRIESERYGQDCCVDGKPER